MIKFCILFSSGCIGWALFVYGLLRFVFDEDYGVDEVGF